MTMNKKNIKKIHLCYGNCDGKMLHLVRMKDGQGLIKTTAEMRRLGLIRMKSKRNNWMPPSDVEAARRAWK